MTHYLDRTPPTTLDGREWTRVDRRDFVIRLHHRQTGRLLDSHSLLIDPDKAENTIGLMVAGAARLASELTGHEPSMAERTVTRSNMAALADWLAVGDRELATICAAFAHGILHPLALVGALRAVLGAVLEATGADDGPPIAVALRLAREELDGLGGDAA